MVGALDAEQVVVRRLGQRGVAGGGFQNGLGDHDRRVQVVLGGDGAGRLAHQRDELLGGEVLAVAARHVGRVVDVREGDGRHRDGHLLERRLGLALDDGGRVRLVRHAAGSTGLLLTGIHRIVRVYDRLVRLRGLIGISRLDRVGRIRGIDGIDGIDGINRFHGIDRIHRLDGIDRINRFTRIIGIGRVGRILGFNRIRRVSRSRRLVRVGRNLRASRLVRTGRSTGFGRLLPRLLVGRTVHTVVSRLLPVLINRRILRFLLRRSRLGRRGHLLGLGLLWLFLLLLGRCRLFGNRQIIERLLHLLEGGIQLAVLLGGQNRPGHNLQIGQRKKLAAVDALYQLFVGLGERFLFGSTPQCLAIFGVASGIGCGHAAHRGNDQRRSSENRYCLPR